MINLQNLRMYIQYRLGYVYATICAGYVPANTEIIINIINV